MQHVISERWTPISVMVSCTCGWRVSIKRRQNAWARTAKLGAAYRDHARLAGVPDAEAKA